MIKGTGDVVMERCPYRGSEDIYYSKKRKIFVCEDCDETFSEHQLSYDNSEGAEVEIGDDFYLSFIPSESVQKVRLSTKYDWQFEDCMKKFSVMEFLKNMIDN